MKFKNKNDYQTKRKHLLDNAQQLLNEGKAEEAEAKMNEITALDEEWDKFAQEQANFRALNEEPQCMAPWIMQDSINRGGSRNVNKDVFLNRNDKLYNRVLENVSADMSELTANGAFGDVIRGMVTGEWKSESLKNMVTTTATGTLIPQVLSSKVIDLARSLSLFTIAGVPVVPMETNNVTISRVKTEPVFRFKKEGEAAEKSNFEMDGINLKSKTCYGYVYVSLESIKSSVNLEDIMIPVFAKAIAQAMDNGMLYGQYNSLLELKDDFAPSGIMDDSEINVVEATEAAGYDDFIKAIGKIKNANGIPKVVGINSKTEEILSMLKTTDGQYLLPPKAYENVEQIVSNQLAYDETNGSDALVFDPASMIIGIQNNITIKIIEDSECLKNGLVGFQIYSMIDCKTVMPKHICRIKGIK